MRPKSILLAMSTFAIFSILVTSATQVRADYTHRDEWEPYLVPPDGIFYDGDDATCAPEETPWSCTTAGDYIDVEYHGNFNSGSSAAIQLLTERVSAGDYTWTAVDLLCDDGQGNQVWYGMACGGGPDYPSPEYCWASCPDNQYASEIDFYYTVTSKSAS